MYDSSLIHWFSSGIDPLQAVREKGYEMYYRSINLYLSLHLENYRRIEINRYNLQFMCDNINIDVLLSPLFNTPSEYYSFLERRSKVERSMYACISVTQ